MTRTNLHFVLAFLLCGTFAFADSGASTGQQTEEVVGRYQEAVARQQNALKDVAVDVQMEARIPKLKKYGTLSALRRISDLGKITYKVLGFSGDDTVKKEVMARYMNLEVEAASNGSPDRAITPANYNFKYKGLQDKNGVRVHVLELKPKSKRVGLFKGEIWLDQDTWLPVREQGQFVKSPSIFIKKVAFVREYEIKDGVSWLTHMESKTDTRLVGSAELAINYQNYHRETPADADASSSSGGSGPTAAPVEDAHNRN